jgi:hypothetical protein
MALNISMACNFAAIAVRDWSLGYGQGTGVGGRWDIRNGGAADCSSLVAWALNQAGLTPALGTDTYTGNLRPRLAAHGWQTLPGTTTPQPGDVLLWEGHHTAICVAPDTLAEAWINELGTTIGGQPGDQTGQETRLIPASQHPDRGRWTHLLRPPTTSSQEDDMTPEQAAQLARIEGYLKVPGYPFGYPAATHNALGSLTVKIAAQDAAIQALAAAKGTDGAAITKTIQDAVDKALADVSITLTAKEN